MTSRGIDADESAGGPLVAFLLLTYLVTWVSWLAAWAISDGGF